MLITLRRTLWGKTSMKIVLRQVIQLMLTKRKVGNSPVFVVVPDIQVVEEIG